MERLKSLQNFCDTLNDYIDSSELKKIDKYLLSADEWNEIEKVLLILQPFHEYTHKLQNQSCSLSDFFGFWTMIKLKLNRQENQDLSRNILIQMSRYQTLLFDNPVMASAIYLDPRFQRALTVNQKILAVHFLSGLHIKLNRMDTNTQNEHHQNNSNNLECDSDDELDNYLNSMNSSARISIDNNITGIERKLKDFDGTRMSLQCKVLDYWNEHKEVHPEMYKLSCVIFAVPATQSSVERAFSAFALILTSRRTPLSDKNLQNILLIRLNRDIYSKMINNV